MFDVWILLFPMLLGAKAFMIHNTKSSMCLEDSAAAGQVLLKKCNLESEAQQWIWVNQGMLMCVGSSKCLSAMQREPLQTQSCWGAGVNVVGLMWDCDRDRLISRNTSMLLSLDDQHLVLTHGSKHSSKWRSLDEGDICQQKLRSRRASHDSEELEGTEEQTGEVATMTEEQRQFLRWFYRTEDPTTWKFVLLGLAFVCLLLGFLLLGMGAMANKNRKKIAKYKAAAAMAQKSEGEEFQVITVVKDDSSKPSPSHERLLQGHEPSISNGEVSELKAGNIVVTWKDGNTSCLYSDCAAEEEKQEEKQDEKQEEKQDEKQEEKQDEKQEEYQETVHELEADEAVKM